MDNADNVASFYQHCWVAAHFVSFSLAEVCSSNPEDCALSTCYNPFRRMSLEVVEFAVLYFDSPVVERMAMVDKRARTCSCCCIHQWIMDYCCRVLATFSNLMRLLLCLELKLPIKIL